MRCPGIFLLLLFILHSTAAAHVRKCYWLDPGAGKILRSNPDGSNAEDVVTAGLNEPVRLAIDSAGNKMYWVDQLAAKIFRANLDGTNLEEIAQGFSILSGIDLDPVEAKIYWCDDGVGKIQRSDLSGGNIEDVLTGLAAVYSIAIDSQGRRVYWTEGPFGRILRANLDGSAVDTLLTDLGAVDGIALDVMGNKMFWTKYLDGQIQKSNLDGSMVESIVTTDLLSPEGIAVDLLNGRVCWTDKFTLRVSCSDFGGGNRYDVFVGTVNDRPRDVDFADLAVSATELPTQKHPVFLGQNYPNPMQWTTAIPLNLGNSIEDEPRSLALQLIDVRGRLVRELYLQASGSAQSQIEWDGRDAEGRRVPNGVYFYRLTQPSSATTRRLVVRR